MAERNGHLSIREVETMFEQTLQAVKDGHRSLHDQQERIVRLLQGLLEGANEDVLAEMLGNNSELIRQASPLLMSVPSGERLEVAKPFEGLDAEEPCSPMEQRVSLNKAVIQELTKQRTRNIERPADLFKPSVLRKLLKKFVTGRYFDFVMGFVIMLNSLYIGFELENSISNGIHNEEEAPVWEYLFLGFYLAELCLRMWAFGLAKTFDSKWNQLDVILVSLGSVSLLILEPVKRHTDSGQGAEFLQQITILRLLRLLRLVRSLRLLQQFKILWGLVNGLLHALPAILSTLALLFLLIFIFACGGVELITKSTSMQEAAVNDPDLSKILDLHFSTLPMVGLTLIRFTTMDSIGGIYEPLVRQQPTLIFYFIFVLLVISITLMNLITAVLVEHSLTMAKNDSDMENHTKRKKIKSMIPKIQELFTLLDSNQDGQLTKQEAGNSEAQMPKALSHLVGRDGRLDTLVDLFEALDSDNSGSVDRAEFVEGLVDLALSEVPLETIKILHTCRVQKKQTKNILNQLKHLGGEVEACSTVLRSPLLMRALALGLVEGNRDFEDCLPLEGHLGEVARLKVRGFGPPMTPTDPQRLLQKEVTLQ